LGVCRIVTARELSLDEIKDMKERTNLEIESFIHGAMCYAYSGQCLFSSILGGRSGNRGRCAGPCRLPYIGARGKEQYPLSLKDLYTLPVLPKLIEAGIDSFKIEGRMKSPEYVAGVTAIYRKYLDAYLENPEKEYMILPKDEQLIRHLYIRSNTCGGYYQQHHNKDMITLAEPGYSGSKQEVLSEIQEKYIAGKLRLPINGYVRICAGSPAVLTFSTETASVTVTGEMVSPARNKPLSQEDIRQKLGKLGDTCFQLTALVVDTDDASFMTVKALNELRRMAAAELEQKLLTPTLRTVPEYAPLKKMPENPIPLRQTEWCVLVTTYEQLMIANAFSKLHRIYVEADLLFHTDNALLPDKEYILVLPHILRKRSYSYLPKYETLLRDSRFSGVMVRNLEELEWIHTIGYTGRIYSDYTIYTWNQAALDFLERQVDGVTLPLELNKKEFDRLLPAGSTCFVLYGYIPLMYSANCIQNTLERCIKDTGNANNRYHLTDRYHNDITIVQNCMHCYNILYNTVPMSLHGQLEHILKKNYPFLRLDFSVESGTQTRAVIKYYLNSCTEFPYKEFTNGHYKRGVE
ncbi:MAG: U32 family peptidase, partial [Lachnospiraceae bacterium]|nr:U32 family peptidase [Lachnospiraceae bacterium]